MTQITKSIVGVKEAAKLMGVSEARVRYLAKQDRIRDVYKIGNSWAIPLYKGMPVITKGKRGPLPSWKTRQRRGNKINIIHVHKQKISKKDKNGYYYAPILIKNSSQEEDDYAALKLALGGPAIVRYEPENPLSCGAKIWIETICDVWQIPCHLDPPEEEVEVEAENIVDISQK